MRNFTEVRPDLEFVQAVLAQIPWWNNHLLAGVPNELRG
jgi:hypothetical protein